MKNRRVNWSFLRAIAALALLFCSAASASTIYQVNPVPMSNGFAISGGFIETDGTIGELTTANIVDYRFEVTGPLPYTFLPTSPGGEILFGDDELIATATDILLALDPSPAAGGDTPEVNINAADSSNPACVDCDQNIFYANALTDPPSTPVDETLIGYSFEDFDDSDPDAGGLFRSEPQQLFAIATIPEPASLAVMGLGGLVVCARRRVG